MDFYWKNRSVCCSNLWQWFLCLLGSFWCLFGVFGGWGGFVLKGGGACLLFSG